MVKRIVGTFTKEQEANFLKIRKQQQEAKEQRQMKPAVRHELRCVVNLNPKLDCSCGAADKQPDHLLVKVEDLAKWAGLIENMSANIQRNDAQHGFSHEVLLLRQLAKTIREKI